MVIDKWPNNDKATKYIPKPVIGTRKAVSNVSSLKFVTNSVRNVMVPNNTCDAQCNRCNDQKHQAKAPH